MERILTIVSRIVRMIAVSEGSDDLEGRIFDSLEGEGFSRNDIDEAFRILGSIAENDSEKEKNAATMNLGEAGRGIERRVISKFESIRLDAGAEEMLFEWMGAGIVTPFELEEILRRVTSASGSGNIDVDEMYRIAEESSEDGGVLQLYLTPPPGEGPH